MYPSLFFSRITVTQMSQFLLISIFFSVYILGRNCSVLAFKL